MASPDSAQDAPLPSPARTLTQALAVAVVALVALGAPVVPLSSADPAAAAPAPLVGTFALDAGSCGGGAATGTYLRMILPTGTRSGPFLSNADSACGDQTFTLLRPGTDGGLVTGGFQSEPSPAFDGAGNSLADRITAPTGFFGVAFSTSTNATDPQTGQTAPLPVVTADGGTLTADLTAFAASWNNQEFNQGAPKPGGTLPGNTAIATGTYDVTTGAFTLEWASQVEGGPFDRFTGLWHLEGHFVPAASGAAPPAAAAPTPEGAAPAAGAAGGGAPAASAPASPAGAASGSSPATAPPAADAAAPTAAAAPVAGSSGGATISAAGPTTRAGEDGWAPPGWLVVSVAVVGLAALGAYVGLERTLRKLEVAA